MTEWGVYLVIGSLVAFIGSIYQLIYKPNHERDIKMLETFSEIKVGMATLNSQLAQLIINGKEQGEQLKVHSTEISDLNLRVKIIENTEYIKDRR